MEFRKLRVLIIENDPDERTFMKEGFTESGLFEIVQFASSVDEVLAGPTGDEDRPDLIITDLNMPGKNGYDLLSEKEQLTHLAGIPVIVVSNSSIDSNRKTCMELGAADYMVKPESLLDYADFARTVHGRFTSNAPADPASLL